MTIQIHFTQTATQTKLHLIDFQQLDWCWQLEENFSDVYFEAIAEGVSGKNIIKACTLMWDGIHVMLTTGEILSYYFQEMNLVTYTTLTKHLKHIYQAYPNLVEVLD